MASLNIDPINRSIDCNGCFLVGFSRESFSCWIFMEVFMLGFYGKFFLLEFHGSFSLLDFHGSFHVGFSWKLSLFRVFMGSTYMVCVTCHFLLL